MFQMEWCVPFHCPTRIIFHVFQVNGKSPSFLSQSLKQVLTKEIKQGISLTSLTLVLLLSQIVSTLCKLAD